MEVSSTILVALMFVGLLSIGIANVLIGLATLFENRSNVSVDWTYIGWVILLLLVSFDLFWQTVEIFSIKEWGFGGFLLMVLGPILIIFGGQVVLPDLSRLGALDLKAHFVAASRDFFILLALLETWQISVDIVIGSGFTTASGTNAATAVLLVGLAVSKRPKIHRVGAIVASLFILSSIVLRVTTDAG